MNPLAQNARANTLSFAGLFCFLKPRCNGFLTAVHHCSGAAVFGAFVPKVVRIRPVLPPSIPNPARA